MTLSIEQEGVAVDYIFTVPTEHFGIISLGILDDGKAMVCGRQANDDASLYALFGEKPPVRPVLSGAIQIKPGMKTLSGLVEEFYSSCVNSLGKSDERQIELGSAIATILLAYGVAKGAVDKSYSRAV